MRAKKRQECKYSCSFYLGDRRIDFDIEKVRSVDYLPYKKHLGILIIEFFPHAFVVKRINGEFITLTGDRKKVRDIKKWLVSLISNREGNSHES